MRAILAAAVVIGAALSCRGTPLDSRVVAVLGAQPPGTPAGSVWVEFLTDPLISSHGAATFVASFREPGTEFLSTGVWGESVEHTLELIARTDDIITIDDQAATIVSFPWESLATPGGGFVGQIGLLQPTSFLRGFFRIRSDASPQLLLPLESQAPGLDTGVELSSFARVRSLDEQGNALVSGRLSGPGIDDFNNESIWSLTDQAASLWVRASDPAPGTDGQLRFADPTVVGAVDGTAVIIADLTDGLGVLRGSGVWRGTLGSPLELILRTGQPAPGLAPGVVLKEVSRAFRTASVTASGRVVLNARVEGPGIDEANDRVVWKESGRGLEVVARSGDPAPGTADDVVFLSDLLGIGNGSGDVLIQGSIAGPGVGPFDGFGIWKQEAAGSLTLVARSDSPAPGTEPGTVFRFPSGNLSSAGTVVVNSSLAGPDVGQRFGGLWVGFRGEELQLISRRGQQIDVDPDPAVVSLKTITGSGVLLQPSAGEGQFISDRDDILIRHTFEDGSAAIVIYTPACPADINADRLATPADLTAWLACFGSQTGTPNCDRADVDGSGSIDASDFTAWLAALDAGCP